MIARPVAPGGRGPGKVKRAQPPSARPANPPSSPRSGWCSPPRYGFGRPASRYRPRGRPAEPSTLADVVGQDGRKVALQIDDDFGLTPGIELAERLVNPVRPGRMIGARHDRLTAMGFHCRGNLRRVGGDRHAADLLRPRPGAARGRSSAGRQCPVAACPADGWRPCGRESAPECGFRSSEVRSGPG